MQASMTGPVLIIEDDRDIAEVLRYSLEREAFSTIVAFNGEEGLKASLDQANPPSVILLDIFLPGMKGTEICRRLRTEPRTQDIPIIIVSAKPIDSSTNHLGADYYIPKPFSVREVIDCVRELQVRPVALSPSAIRTSA
ncbi:MAG TPA: response regulator [Pyrinomonadaceae bacterium]|nr:response regulator [Pyrinomonadaceae bacterium]